MNHNLFISSCCQIFFILSFQEYLVPNFLHLVISYADKSLSIAEAACVKSFILKQNPGTCSF